MFRVLGQMGMNTTKLNIFARAIALVEAQRMLRPQIESDGMKYE